jgi:hypothetical protein
MENQSVVTSKVSLLETLRQVGIAVAIGAAINFITMFAQAILGWLHGIEPEAPGMLVGFAKYLWSWKTSRFG